MFQADRLLVMILYVVQTVSYAQFLYPTNALDRHKPSVDLTLPLPYSRNSIPRSFPPSRLNSTVGLDLGMSHKHSYTQTTTLRLVRTSYRHLLLRTKPNPTQYIHILGFIWDYLTNLENFVLFICDPGAQNQS